MTIALKYLDTGQIIGNLVAPTLQDLQENIKANAQAIPKTKYFILSQDKEFVSNEIYKWRINTNTLKLMEKTKITLTPSKPQILADGIDECVVQLSPSYGVEILVNITPVVVPKGESLILTSDVPIVFFIRMRNANYYCNEITIEAV